MHAQAVGSAHAIAHVFGKGDALKSFRRALGMGRSGPGGGSDMMRELRRRVTSVMDLTGKTP